LTTAGLGVKLSSWREYRTRRRLGGDNFVSKL
jgi:hypothetical protein